jgi:molybdopterin-guanine dinucleotide biosynthesis protein A
VVTSCVERRDARISGTILAGGRARRLGGVDKAALVIGAERIIDRQLAALSTVADDIRIVANDPARYEGLGVAVIRDAIPGAGALGGLYSALLHAAHDWVLVLACDLPFVTRELLGRLAVEATCAGDDIDAVVPRSTRGLEPLCAVYRTRCAPAMEARIARGELRIAGALDDLRVREVGPAALAQYDEGALFENINTPHDYERARDRVELNEKPPKDRITE